LHDPAQLHLLLLGGVFGVLPERITGVLDAGSTSAGACRGILGGPATGPYGFVGAGRFPGVVARL
jgi:hypothetical protein